MKKKVSLILWLFCIATYIFNIVLVCVNGATLINSILAWCCCILLTISIILLEIKNNRLKETREKELKEWKKIVNFFLELKQENEDQKEQKTENKGVIYEKENI